jgi:hypothetical protein
MLRKKFLVAALPIPLLAISLSLAFAQSGSNETITITTYYPSPYGVYNEMRAKKIGIGDTYYNSSSHPIIGNTDLIVEGNVGIGTDNPDVKLDVVGGKVQADDFCLQDDSKCLSSSGGGIWTGTRFVQDGIQTSCSASGVHCYAKIENNKVYLRLTDVCGDTGWRQTAGLTPSCGGGGPIGGVFLVPTLGSSGYPDGIVCHANLYDAPGPDGPAYYGSCHAGWPG